MNGARSVVEKADEDFILDESEMTDGEEQEQSIPTAELMHIIHQLRVENVALAKANSELRRQSQHSIYTYTNGAKSPADESQNYQHMLEIMRKEAQELKEIRDLAEARTQSTISYITQLEQQVDSQKES
ncbi:hypothetical protein EX30DRAFT_98118 [Ascodesmis nigricans]|uniref:Uncharacterized protein n=1 Tax=Ascodesmis nigricans TaxID=341454 RepID=A0A4S2N4I8_9PEZI|nr:hypothetical protein EX30DRAFT_98118 [Ascodesmis nigricans]